MAFPINRPRRLRRNETLRRMIRETRLAPEDFIQPYFVCPGRDVKKPVGAMPGVAQMSVDHVAREARETYAAGVPAVILFGIPQRKDPQGSAAWPDPSAPPPPMPDIKAHLPAHAVRDSETPPLLPEGPAERGRGDARNRARPRRRRRYRDGEACASLPRPDLSRQA